MNKASIFGAFFSILFLLTSCSYTPSSGGPNTVYGTGKAAGAIIGAIAGNNIGGGGNANVIAGAIIGGVLGEVVAGQYNKKREELEAQEAQRQYEYELEVREQEKLEQEIKTLEEQKMRERIAQTATEADVHAAEREAARVEAKLSANKNAYEESQRRAKRIQDAQERIARAQKELAELEAKEIGTD